MGVITLPWSMVQDQQNQVKANSVHVDDNFNTLLNATNGKLEADGSIVPTADLPMGNHKITGVATPTNSGDAATKGYVDTLSVSCVKLTGAQTVGGVKTFTSSPVVPTPTNNTDACTKKYVDDGLAGCVKTSGNQTIAGAKTFTNWTKLSGGGETTTPAVTYNDNQFATTAFVNNFLRKSFSNTAPTLTQISTSSEYSSGDIALSQSFKNFDYIMVFYGNDASQNNNVSIMPTWQLDWLLTHTVSGKSVLLGSTISLQSGIYGVSYWTIKPYADGTTATLFKVAFENSIIHTVYGFNL